MFEKVWRERGQSVCPGSAKFDLDSNKISLNAATVVLPTTITSSIQLRSCFDLPERARVSLRF